MAPKGIKPKEVLVCGFKAKERLLSSAYQGQWAKTGQLPFLICVLAAVGNLVPVRIC